jgi:hypothetical protein
MRHPRPNAAAILVLAILPACRGTGGSAPSPSPGLPLRASPAVKAPATDPFEAWLQTDFPAADGFDFPLRELGESDVRAVAHGRVAFAGDCGPPWGHLVMIDHVFYENHERRQIRSVYGQLTGTHVRPDEVVKRNDVIGTVTPRPGRHAAEDLRLELRWDVTLPPTCTPSLPAHDEARVRQHFAAPSTFIAARRRLAVPQDEPALLLVDTRQGKLAVWLQGERIGDFEVAFGQQEGRKRLQHDLRTPLGMYFVVGKSRGPFTGPYSEYYGGHWIKVNYPNAYDADWGRGQGLLTNEVAASIAEAWRARKPTFQGSPLGGGIGFHGWADDWDLNGPRGLSWGCVVMRNNDIGRLFDRIPLGAMVVIL